MKKKKSVIPGFGLSFGIVMAILGLIVIIPLCSLVVFSCKLSFHDFVETVTRPRVLASYKVSILTALVASLINAVMGLAIAWVLVRYNFPGKRIMDGIIELPFALPTAVAGIALTHLTVPEGWVGKIFDGAGVKIAYTRIGITIAPLMIMAKLQEFDYASATSIALVMLLIAFAILFVNAFIQSFNSKIVSGID